MQSYYEILGVSHDADALSIKKAHRSLVKKYHPDIYKGEDREEKFKEIQKAYEVIGDEKERIKYDRSSHERYAQEEAYQSGYRGTGSFSNKIRTFKFNDMAWYKKILFIIGIIFLFIFILIGIIIWLIFKIISFFINLIFRSK